MAKARVQIGPKIRSDREFQSRLIADMEAMTKCLWNIQAALACMADYIQFMSPETRKLFKEATKSPMKV